MNVILKYPGQDEMYWEHLDAAVEFSGEAMLLQHAAFLPLAPGDRVRSNSDGVITDVVMLADLYTVEVDFYVPGDLPAFTTPTDDHRSMQAVAKTLAGWEEVGLWVTRTTNYSALVSHWDSELMEYEVMRHKYVEGAQIVRQPFMEFDFAVAIQHPDIDGRREGPWA